VIERWLKSFYTVGHINVMCHTGWCGTDKFIKCCFYQNLKVFTSATLYPMDVFVCLSLQDKWWIKKL